MKSQKGEVGDLPPGEPRAPSIRGNVKPRTEAQNKFVETAHALNNYLNNFSGVEGI